MVVVVEEKATNVSEIEEDSQDEEPGEVIESAPPLKVGEEREFKFNSSAFKKKLLKRGIGWETPEIGDEPTGTIVNFAISMDFFLTVFVGPILTAVHYVGTLLDGTKFVSTRDKGEPFSFKVGHGQMVTGFDHGIVTMKKGEIASLTLPPDLGYGAAGTDDIPPNSVTQFEVELLSWITVVDVCKDGGIIKRIVGKGGQAAQPGELDEVLVKYIVRLADDVIVAKSPEHGVEFYMKNGHFCSALPKAIKTMKRGEKANLIVQPQYAFGEGGSVNDDGFPSIPPNSVLSIDLELISIKPVVDVTSDSKVIKKILKEGEGSVTANEGASVTIRYKAMLEDGTVFEKKGYDGETPLEFVTDEEQVIDGLDRATATMKKEELALLTISHEYGYGTNEVKRDLAIVPPFSTIVYEVEMLAFVKEKAPWEMSNRERIEAAGMKKEGGNKLFKNGKFQRAAKKYDKAADYVGEDGSFGDDDLKLVKPLQVSCWLNSAACSLKLNEIQEAIKLCSKVLDVEFYNVKALYRRAQAYMETADLQLAALDIKKALEADPQNREVKLLQKDLKILQAESNKRDTKLYTNMFARMAKDGSVPAKRPKHEKPEDDRKDEAAVAMEMEKVAVSCSAPHDNEMVVDSC